MIYCLPDMYFSFKEIHKLRVKGSKTYFKQMVTKTNKQKKRKNIGGSTYIRQKTLKC